MKHQSEFGAGTATNLGATMNNIIVKQSTISSAWHVTLPEYPSNQIWSCHDTQADAEREAGEIAADMGYDGVTVL